MTTACGYVSRDAGRGRVHGVLQEHIVATSYRAYRIPKHPGGCFECYCHLTPRDLLPSDKRMSCPMGCKYTASVIHGHMKLTRSMCIYDKVSIQTPH